MRHLSKIVVHHTAVDQPDIEKMISSMNRTHKQRLHKKPNGFGNHVAYHYLIGIDGEVRYLRPINEVGYHASNWEVNKTSIGICLSGDFDNKEPSKEQYSSCSKLIKELQEKHGALTIHPHSQFARKSCPGYRFDFSKIINAFMLFYEKLYKENFQDIPEDQRVFKDPESFIERMDALSMEDKFNEMVYLLAILTSKLDQEKADKSDCCKEKKEG